VTLHQLLRERVEADGSAPALLTRDGAVAFDALEQEQNQLATFLAARGLAKGARVAVLLERSREAVVSLLAVSRAGGIVVPMNFRLPRSLLAPMMHEVSPAFAIVQSDLGGAVLDEPERWGLGSVATFVTVGNGSGVLWSEAVSVGRRGELPEPPDEGVTVYLAYTSGTTGPPRAASVSHQNIFWNARAVKEALGLTCEDVHLLTFPPYMQPHEFISRSLVCGGPTVLVETLRPHVLFEAIAECGVTSLVTVPRLARALLPSLSEHGKPGRLRMIVLSSEVPSRALFAALQRTGLAVFSSWGSAETAGMALCGKGPGTVGKACPYYEIAVEGGEDTGIMLVGGPGVSRGYFAAAAERSTDLHGGWFRTGDLVRVEPSGEVAMFGRVGAFVAIAGGTLDMAELERRLSTRPEFAGVLVRRGFGGVPIAVYAVPAQEELDLADARRVLGDEASSLWAGTEPGPPVPAILENMKLTLVSTLPERSPLGGRAELVEIEEMMQEVDRQVVTLLNERARLARRLKDIREKGDLPPFDPGRDEEMLRAALGSNTGPLYDQALEQILRNIQDHTFLAD
jgi:acyl-coenzyme A synthetase/AMP-(fatty) acid ligase/chorismate mutase